MIIFMKSNPALTPKKVLIVEDDQILLRMLSNMFTQAHLVVLTARNGIEGIDRINETRPDLILLDIDMPKMNGIAMLRSMREGGRGIPTIMLTNLNNPQLIADAAGLGASEYLIKADWEIDDIVAKIAARLHADK